MKTQEKGPIGDFPPPYAFCIFQSSTMIPYYFSKRKNIPIDVLVK